MTQCKWPCKSLKVATIESIGIWMVWILITESLRNIFVRENIKIDHHSELESHILANLFCSFLRGADKLQRFHTEWPKGATGSWCRHLPQPLLGESWLLAQLYCHLQQRQVSTFLFCINKTGLCCQFRDENKKFQSVHSELKDPLKCLKLHGNTLSEGHCLIWTFLLA